MIIANYRIHREGLICRMKLEPTHKTQPWSVCSGARRCQRAGKLWKLMPRLHFSSPFLLPPTVLVTEHAVAAGRERTEHIMDTKWRGSDTRLERGSKRSPGWLPGFFFSKPQDWLVLWRQTTEQVHRWVMISALRMLMARVWCVLAWWCESEWKTRLDPNVDKGSLLKRQMTTEATRMGDIVQRGSRFPQEHTWCTQRDWREKRPRQGQG